MKYSIFTICTENYRDAYEFVIDSWLNNTKAEKIYIYTDDDKWKISNPRIELVKFLDKSTDWLKIVKTKTTVFKHFLTTYNIDNSIFVDMDCYIKEDLGHVFENKFDVAVTRLNQKRTAVSTGIILVKNREKMIPFLDEWNNQQEHLDSKRRKVKERTCSNNQKSFSDLIRKKNRDRKMNVLDLDVDIYNRKAKPNRIKDLVKQEKAGKKIKVLHFYNTSYRNKKYVKQVTEEIGL
jgi:UDP-N-acetylglucosamine pyrophosphorylase